MNDQPWDDERLAAAFADQFDRPAPRDLTTATLERIGATTRRPPWWPTFDRAFGGRFAVAVVAVAIVSLLGLAVLPRTSTEPADSARPGTTPASVDRTPIPSFPPSPAVAGFPAVAAGLQVRSIADARALLADPRVRDTELAVAGWYAASDLVLPCPYADLPQSPIEIRCGDIHTWLTDDEQPILSSDGSTLKLPDPARSLDLRFVPPVDPIRSGTGPRGQQVTTPLPVVVVGHFYDERYSRCPAELLATCEQTFVVDAVATSTGVLNDPAATSAGRGEAGRLTASDAVVIARRRLAGSGEVLAVGLAVGSDPPWFSPAPSADRPGPATWFVRGYRILSDGTTDRRGPGTPVAGWLAIDDATSAVTGTLLPPPASASPPSSPAPAFPATVEGLPVIGVREAIGPLGPDDRPIAVAGWLSRLPIHPCPSPDDGTCERDTVILSDIDRQLVSYGPGGFATLVQPIGAVLYPALLPGSAPLPTPTSAGSPRPVVLVMHRNDKRADRDGPSLPVGRREYVLDQVAWLDGREQPPTVWIQDGVQPTRSPDNLFTILGPRIVSEPWWIVSRAAVRTKDLPSIGGSPPPIDWLPAPSQTGVVWMVRVTGTRFGGGGPGWGVALVDDETGSVAIRWTDNAP